VYAYIKVHYQYAGTELGNEIYLRRAKSLSLVAPGPNGFFLCTQSLAMISWIDLRHYDRPTVRQRHTPIFLPCEVAIVATSPNIANPYRRERVFAKQGKLSVGRQS
jgi:hypothetical protein